MQVQKQTDKLSNEEGTQIMPLVKGLCVIKFPRTLLKLPFIAISLIIISCQSTARAWVNITATSACILIWVIIKQMPRNYESRFFKAEIRSFLSILETLLELEMKGLVHEYGHQKSWRGVARLINYGAQMHRRTLISPQNGERTHLLICSHKTPRIQVCLA